MVLEEEWGRKEGRTVMKKEISEKELFETIPVPRAVATLAIPTIISQVVTMIYNLADTCGIFPCKL